MKKDKRLDFSKIKVDLPIPDLIEVQKNSYERFLQMNLLPEERENYGLQGVFRSVFPFVDYREIVSLDFVKYTIGNWRCKCGHLKGLEYLRIKCESCGAPVMTAHPHEEYVTCKKCGYENENKVIRCDICGGPVELQHQYTIQECKERGLTYSVPLKVTFRLTIYDKNPVLGKKVLRDAREEEVYFGEIPLITDKGSFIVNGTERVIVSQLHRSPGVFFTEDRPRHYIAKIIPYKGSWVEFEYDLKHVLYVRIDRRKRILGTVFLRALGFDSDEDILTRFYAAVPVEVIAPDKVRLTVTQDVAKRELLKEKVAYERKLEYKIFADITISADELDKICEGQEKAFEIDISKLSHARFLRDVVDLDTGEVLFEANEPVPTNMESSIKDRNITPIEVFFPQWDVVGDVISNTLIKDNTSSTEEALLEIYTRMRPGDIPTLESARNLFNSMFFDPKKYDFSEVGRFKFNVKFDLSTPLTKKTLSPEDFCLVIEYLLRLHRNIGQLDDIDNLANRRVRSVGELLENQFLIGLARMERVVRERMSVHQDLEGAMPHDIVNSKQIMASIKEFFGTFQLSQFMDQVNPLAEITHKRRLSALGPGGLTRERAGFEVRDVHVSHYGRICPIETPEGANIGLISSLATYARINKYGFIESPYKKVENGRVIDHFKITKVGDSNFSLGDIVTKEELEKEINRLKRKKNAVLPEAVSYAFYLTAWEETKYVIAQATSRVDKKGRLLDKRVIARTGGEFVIVDREKVDYIDVSPKQIFSVAASLIPFLEHDDANRALMGSNMQRQAVPLIQTEAPIVGTGMEEVVAKDSGAVVVCQRSGIVESADANRIIVRVTGEEGEEVKEFGADIYQLTKFQRSNQNTCVNQRPIVREGDRVKRGQVLADGPATADGELALGRNVLVAFMPWRGYNFEDAILISEKLVKEDVYTSIHIEEFEIEARDTKLGPEEITRDIPNVSENALRNLDESGIVRIGARVKSGDILVGKVTPKGETQMSPEEKLLRAIFGEKAADVRDASLRVPPGVEGIVINVKVFSRKGVKKDSRQLQIEEDVVERLRKNLKDQERILIDERNNKINKLLIGKKLSKDLFSREGVIIKEKGDEIDEDLLKQLTRQEIIALPLENKELNKLVKSLYQRTDRYIKVLRDLLKKKVDLLQAGDDLPPGVNKLVKVYVAMKRKLQVGDKMAGRHGNKGVISRVLPEEDMPFLPDGTPIDIVLNPLGVPSRMNVGQIFETHLGWAGKVLGLKFASPVFDGVKKEDIVDFLQKAGLPKDGKTVLYDGITGEPFEQKVTVGYLYMMKLNHLVDDKIHARSIGPYSLITQQPLGGKAQFGGQRFGEMEVWALEGYGAAYTLQELLTVKSDDVEGRSKIYEAIVRGEVPPEPGLPESFNVLMREMQGLCLDVELLKLKEGENEQESATDEVLEGIDRSEKVQKEE